MHTDSLVEAGRFTCPAEAGDMILIRLHCPACGAPLRPGENGQVECDFCDSILLVRERWVEEQPRDSALLEVPATPPSTLSSERAARFELSLLEQLAEHPAPDGYGTFVLSGERFALVFLRLTDDSAKTLEADYPDLLARLSAALSLNEDPGLAAFELLEYLCEIRADFKLEVQILLFNPFYSSVTAYNAGGNRSLYWVSGEEGRVIDIFRAYPPLERKMLRMSQDHFSNSKPVLLSAADLVVGVSAAYAGRGGGSYSDGTPALVRSLNQHLGEPPLRVVTLAKNAYWNDRPPAAKESPPSGPLRVAAVRVLPSVPAERPGEEEMAFLSTLEFEIAYLAKQHDHAELLPLHDQRHVFLWLDGDDFSREDYEKAREAVLALLDRPNYGDNENPRRAGREAAEAVGHSGRMLVLQLFDKHGRSKWYRCGWAQPIGLGPRGLGDPPSSQAFDDGGEATVPPGARQFFPGSLPLRRPASKAEELAGAWYGGKASALYSELFGHWRVPDQARCLAKLLRAAKGDYPGTSVDGACLCARTKST